MIMNTGVPLLSLDSSWPVELSPKAIDDRPLKQLGYDGLVITARLYMRGSRDYWPLSQAATLAIIANNDLVKGPYAVDDALLFLSDRYSISEEIAHGQFYR